MNEATMNKSQVDSINSSNLINAKLEEHQRCRSKECPSCGHKFERKLDWVGLPAGVKFDPSDQELIKHLEAKVMSDLKSHPLINEFIPTIEGEGGICYTHPKRLSGVTRDGLSKHFFHRPSKAYTTGTRKKRKIQTLQDGETRWHKTGKTRPVMVNGRQKGCKKILVLYTNFGKNRKPKKTNWVMHQYHLGELEEEKEGELMVSKIFYQMQSRQCNLPNRATTAIVSDAIEMLRDSGSASSSSKEVISQRDDKSCGGGILGYNALNVQHINSDGLILTPFKKYFNEAPGAPEVAAPVLMQRDDAARTCRDRQEHQQQALQDRQRQVAATAAFQVSMPSAPVSAILPSAMILEDPCVVSTMLLQHDNLQQQQHHKLAERSTFGLEELILGCTSTGIKGEASIPSTQEAEWLKYSCWPDPGNPSYHG